MWNRRFFVLPLVLMLACFRSDAAEAQRDGFRFRVAEGYELTKIAGEDLVTRPTVCDWDDQGRLVVVSSAGAEDSVREQLETKPHSVLRLIDDDGDGVFDRRIVAAQDLSFYSGVLCHGNDIFVSAPPSVWKLTDADGDGICESREVWHDGGTVTYCANDLHGPYLGPDGWIYWCKGAFGKQTHRLTDGTTVVSEAAHILRKRPEGGRVEIVTSGGMDNPIELAFLGNGEKFFTSTFLQHPADGRRDGIAHAVHGSVFGKIHRVIDDLPRTGDVMPVMTHLGPAAPSGLMRRRFGSDPGDVLVCAQFNLRRLSQHTLIADGATYRTLDTDLVTCDRLDFHPTDVIEDFDGSVVFLDTGDWYDLCCPSSGAEGKRSPGGVYRLRRVDAERSKRIAIDWADTDAEAAVAKLNDPSFVVRDRASDWLVDHPAESVPALRRALRRSPLTAAVASRIAWVSARIGGTEAIELFEWLLDDDRSPEVHHATLMAAMHAGELAPRRVGELLVSSPDAGVRRAAAEWTGRHGNEDDVADLMTVVARSDAGDRVLQHSLRYALIRLDRPDALVEYLAESRSTAEKLAALTVLGQIAPTRVASADAFRLLQNDDEQLQRLAAETLARGTNRSEEHVDALIKIWKRSPAGSSLRTQVAAILAARIDQPEVNGRVLDTLNEPVGHRESLQLVASIPITTIPAGWDRPLDRMIDSADRETKLQLADWLSEAELDPSDHRRTTDRWIDSASDERSALIDRLRFAAAIPAGVPADRHGLSGVLVDALSAAGDGRVSSLAGRVVRRLPIDRHAAEELLNRLNDATTSVFPTMVAAIAGSGETAAGRLLRRLPEYKVARTLPKEFLVNVFDRYDSFSERAEQVAEELSRPPADVAHTLSTLMSELPPGDMVRGMRIFHGEKSACGKCHRFGYVGGRIGPELTRIGRTRSRSNLLEAIVYPSAHLAQGYRSVRILTVDGAVFNGLVQSETSEELELATGIDGSIKIRKDQIEIRQDSDTSIMPAGLDGSMTKQELADVLELLSEFRKR